MNQKTMPGCSLTWGMRAGVSTHASSAIGSDTTAQMPRILAKLYCGPGCTLSKVFSMRQKMYNSVWKVKLHFQLIIFRGVPI